MALELFFAEPIENHLIVTAVASFTFFLAYVLCGRVASGEQSYSQVNKLHLRVYALFCLLCLIQVALKKEFSISTLLGFLVGSFIYFSLHVVYLFSLIGLAKKSISINILASIKLLETKGLPTTEASLARQMEESKISMGDIRESRLKQMTGLGFAQLSEKKYVITPFGKRVHQTGALILKIWNQRRL